MMTRLSIAALAAWLIAPLPALAQPVEPAPGEPASTEVVSNEPVIELIDAGQSPRRALRLAPKVGQKQSLTMRMDIEMAMSVSGMDMPAQPLPTTVMTIDTVVKEIKADGDIVLGFEITDAKLMATDGVDAFVVSQMQPSMDAIKGLTGTSTTSNRGVSRTGEVEVPEGVTDEAAAQFEQVEDNFSSLGVPLPVEQIGVGARWTVRTRLDTNGIRLEQITDCELIEIAGDSVGIRTRVRQSAPPQEITTPDIPAGMTVQLTSFEGSGKSVFTLMLDEMLPRRAESTVAIDMSMEIGGAGMGGGVQEMSQALSTAVEADGTKARR